MSFLSCEADVRGGGTYRFVFAQTLLVMHDPYPSKEALDGAIASGSTGGMGETFEQLDELLVALGASAVRS